LQPSVRRGLMTLKWKIVIGLLVLSALGAFAAGLLLMRFYRQRFITLVGAVIQQATDPRGESPIAGAEISADGLAVRMTRSNFSGLFKLALRPGVERGQAITLLFRHPGYAPLDMPTFVGDQLYIARMVPIHPESKASAVRGSVLVSDVRVRYSVQSTTADTVGTAAKTFQVVNTANVPCGHDSLCSPDGKWKAAMGSASLDAGKGNIFAHPRVSCIAGPCPFTSIDFEGLAQGGRVAKVTARAWSDTATFLLQAEVVHPEVGDAVQESYPVIFGREMNFSLPAAAEGPSLEATLNGVQIIFPLPPNPDLSWADCRVRLEEGRTKLYRCELKPGYQFR
jgi:hypothetical protein